MGKRWLAVVGYAAAVLQVTFSSGCAMLNGFLDPTTVGWYPLEYEEREIRRVLTPRDHPSTVPNATEPRPEDLLPTFDEYRVVPGDQVQLVIEDFLGQGLREISSQAISNDGFIRLPFVGAIRVGGMTEFEVEQEIAQRLRDRNIMPDPIVRVTLLTRRAAEYEILGSVGRAGTYPILRPDLRILDAIGLAADIGGEVRKLYVIRREEQDVDEGPALDPTDDVMSDDDLIVPPPIEDEASFGVILTADAATQPTTRPATDELDAILRPAPGSNTERSFEPLVFDPETGEQIELGPEPIEPETAPAPQVLAPPVEEGFDWDDVPQYELQQRVIEIDVRALKAGDPRFNIVVRPGDVINVPLDTSVFYVMGEVNRPGVYAFGGREVTLKQAVALVGNFAPLAFPARSEIIRREPGTDRQITIPVNIDAIFAGIESDVLLRDQDILNVGTSVISPFLFVIRNSFRFTYGFGFVYDRNFADIDTFSSKVNPNNSRILADSQRGGLPF